MTEHSPDTPLPLGATPRNAWHVSESSVDMTRSLPPVRPVTLRDRDRAVTIDLSRTAIIVEVSSSRLEVVKSQTSCRLARSTP